MVEYDLMQIIQMISWLATATGVCFAAYYYVTTLSNADKNRRKEMIQQKLPNFNMEYYDAYYTVYNMGDWNTLEEFQQKYNPHINPIAFSKLMYLLNFYNVVGILLIEKVASLDEIFRLYTPVAIIGLYERYEPVIKRNRYTRDGEAHNPDYLMPFELLYLDAKRRYPKTPPWSRSFDESNERTRLMQEKGIFESPK